MKRLFCFVLIALCLLSTCSCSEISSLLSRENTEDTGEHSSRSLYDQMLAAMESGESEATLHGDFSAEDLKKTYRQIHRERPDLFWLGSSWTGSLESSSSGDTTAHLKFACYGEKEDNRNMREALLEKADSLADACRELPLYDQLLFVHDSIINACRYDEESADAITEEASSREVLLASTAYGCLMEGKAVCSGYAAAFSLVMQKLSVPCRRVTGVAYGEPHEWNLVQVEDHWVHMDLTWDDPTTKDGSDALVYDYFCIPDDEILLSHQPDEDQELPVCDYEGYGWYGKNGMTLKEATQASVYSCLQKQIDEGRSSYFIKFTQDPKENLATVTDEGFLNLLQQSLGIRLRSYRINALNNAVEFFPAKS